MPELTIDGRAVEVAPGTNLIEAARRLGIEIPYYCYHPALSTVGSCRMCQVELHDEGKPPRIVIACRTEATKGLRVSTTGKDCVAARAATLEFLLANHPLDCPICDKAGECDLQDFSYRHGRGAGRFDERKREGVKHELIGDHILLDQERCILCTRCVRFMAEYAKSPSLVVAGRGDRNVIATFPGQPIRSNYEGNLADVCPVGALTNREFRFKSRVWDLAAAESVCTGCDRGCSVLLETKRNRLLRVRPRVNLQVNGHFMCDQGRFGLLEHCNPARRETRAFLGGQPVEPAAAAAALAQRIAAGSGGGRAWLIVLSARMTLEEIALARAALATIGPLVHVEPAAEGGDDILFTGRRAANGRALELAGSERVAADELRTRAAAAAAGGSGVLCFDAAAARELASLPKRPPLALADVWREPADAAPLGADWFIPGTLFSEKDGSFVNLGSVLQAARRAQRPPAGTVSESELLRAIAREAGVDLGPFESAPDPTFAALESLGLPALTLNQIPADGAKLEARSPAETASP